MEQRRTLTEPARFEYVDFLYSKEVASVRENVIDSQRPTASSALGSISDSSDLDKLFIGQMQFADERLGGALFDDEDDNIMN